MKQETTIGDALRTRMQAQLDREIMCAMTCTAATAPPGPALTQEALRGKLREWGNLIRESRRTNVTLVVVDGHTGPPLHTQHPTEGRFIECSYAQAREVHRQTPLRLVKVLDVDRAHFEVAAPIHGTFCPLIPPPYEVPPHA